MTKFFSIFKEAPVKLKERKKKQSKIKKKESKNCKKKQKQKQNRKERNLNYDCYFEFRTTPFSLKKVESIENR